MKSKFKIRNVMTISSKVIIVAMVLVVGNNIVFATEDPLSVINNLKSFMYQIIGAIGTILLLWGIVQIGMAIKSHDPSQRANRIYDSCRWSHYCICKASTRINFKMI